MIIIVYNDMKVESASVSEALQFLQAAQVTPGNDNPTQCIREVKSVDHKFFLLYCVMVEGCLLFVLTMVKSYVLVMMRYAN
jgi:hypothetical protein